MSNTDNVQIFLPTFLYLFIHGRSRGGVSVPQNTIGKRTVESVISAEYITCNHEVLSIWQA